MLRDYTHYLEKYNEILCIMPFMFMSYSEPPCSVSQISPGDDGVDHVSPRVISCSGI